MSDQPSIDETARMRHAVRTRLNHIVGYGDILRQDAEEAERDALGDLFDRIRETALSLRGPLDLRFAAAGDSVQLDFDTLDREIYSILYELIGFIQEAKRRAEDYDDHALSRDIDKILEGANGLLELLAVEQSGAAENESARAAPAASPTRALELDADELDSAPRSGRILIVDDNLFNRELLARHLERQGHHVHAAPDGPSALELLRAKDFDIMILDLMMPAMSGYQMLELVRSDERFRDLYIIVISSLTDTQSIARCIQLGAEDYLPREFEPVILKARIESCLEKKSLKEEQALYISALVEAQERLRAELREGAAYVRSLLPARLALPELKSDWMFIPSASLGGDVFGYHLIHKPDDDGLAAAREITALSGPVAIYLIDVSGHGIESALFSVTLMNLLKAQAVPGVDFTDPASVLARLSASFRMEDQNYLYFTAWYGVWNPATRALSFASAGSPPALLVPPNGKPEALETGGVIVGLDAKAVYRTGSVKLEPGSKLYLFSDGVYEFRDKTDKIFGLEAFISVLASHAAHAPTAGSALDAVLHDVQARAAKTRFLDDVSLLEFVFG